VQAHYPEIKDTMTPEERANLRTIIWLIHLVSVPFRYEEAGNPGTN
jgi:hypothetical protein